MVPTHIPHNSESAFFLGHPVHSSIDLGTQSTTLRNAVTLALILDYLKLLLSCTQAKDSFGLMLKKIESAVAMQLLVRLEIAQDLA